VLWGRDNRGAALRVIGSCGDESTRIENRIGEPAANPYLYLASQIHAGLDGIARALPAPQATVRPYADSHERLPDSLEDALVALESNRVLRAGFGDAFVGYFARIKRCELARYEAAQDKMDFQRREYFSRV
jgi:glutamine synthetase